jgi:hypothetical protein
MQIRYTCISAADAATKEEAMADTKTTATQVGRDTADKVRESMATNELAQKAKDAAYTIVGLGVMGAQRATMATKQAGQQLRGDDASSTLDVERLRAKTKDATAAARKQFGKFDEVVGGAIARIEEALAPIEERLPQPAKETVQKVKVAGRELHAKVVVKVAGELETPAPAKASAKRAADADAA